MSRRCDAWCRRHWTAGGRAGTPLGSLSAGGTWFDATVGDVNGDGLDDVIARTADHDWWAGLSNGTTISEQRLGSFDTAFDWEHPVVGDFDGDGALDLLARNEQTGGWEAALLTGPQATDAIYSVWITVSAGRPS